MAVSTRDRSPDRSSVPGEDELNDLLWECAAYVDLMGEAALSGTPLTLASSGLLISVRAEPGITMAEIARRKPKTQQAVSQVVARMEKLGLVERRLGSGRGVGLFLTEAGEAIAAEGSAREGELRARVRELIGRERYEALSVMLAETRDILRENR